MPKHEIVYIGSSPLGLRKLVENHDFHVTDALCLEARVTPELSKTAREFGFEIKKFRWIKEFRDLIDTFQPQTKFFIYQLDMLVPGDLTEIHFFYNVHRGSLATNRGPNPDIWPILNGDAETSLSLHRINDKVDAGVLIAAEDVSILEDDDTHSVKQKLEERLPNLVRALAEHLGGTRGGTALQGGDYRPWITEKDFTIFLDDSVDVIDRKIRSQRQYNGAILMDGDQKLYVLDILEVEGRPWRPQRARSLQPTAKTLRVQTHAGPITFVLNPTPKYPPPPIRPPSKRV